MGMPRGETLPIARVWALAQAWYGSRMDPDYRGRTSDQARDLFRSLGLTSPFWTGETVE